MNREKSFDEARTAVQNQIEKIFQKAAAKKGGVAANGQGGGAKTTVPPGGVAVAGVAGVTPSTIISVAGNGEGRGFNREMGAAPKQVGVPIVSPLANHHHGINLKVGWSNNRTTLFYTCMI